MEKPISILQAEVWSDALSDILCWLDGFKAGGGVYFPDSTEALRDLNRKMKEIADKTIKTDVSHT